MAAAALHGGLTQGARNGVLNAFRAGTLPVLVATDVAARGIHVDDVGLVLQVDPPQDHKDYLHRAGRTARAGGRGTVVTLALPHQRKAVDRLTAQAGVDVQAAPARPGDETWQRATGARRLDAPPVSDEDVRRLTSAPRGSGSSRPFRSGGPRREGGPRRTEGGPRRSEGGPRRTEGGPRRTGGPKAGGGKRFGSKPTRSR